MEKSPILEDSNKALDNNEVENEVTIVGDDISDGEENSFNMLYVSDLLYKNNCVIIPELGGFIAEYKSASINRVNNTITPPTKKIVFNERLKNNDGLLAHHISVVNNVSYNEANKVIDNFVTKCQDSLANNKKIRFPEIGIIWRDNENNIQFEPEYSANYLEDSFGMDLLSAPQITKTEIDNNIRASYKPKDKKKVKKEGSKKRTSIVIPSYLRWAAVFIPIILIGVWAIYNMDTINHTIKKYSGQLVNNEDQYLQYQDSIDNRLKEYNDRVKELERINTGTAGIFTPESVGINQDDIYVEESDPDKEYTNEESIDYSNTGYDPEQDQGYNEYNDDPQPVVEQTPVSYATNEMKYHIIVGAYKTKASAKLFVKQLNDMGYLASLAGQSSNGYYRVSAISTNDAAEAEKMLRIIQSEEYPSAWLLKE